MKKKQRLLKGSIILVTLFSTTVLACSFPTIGNAQTDTTLLDGEIDSKQQKSTRTIASNFTQFKNLIESGETLITIAGTIVLSEDVYVYGNLEINGTGRIITNGYSLNTDYGAYDQISLKGISVTVSGTRSFIQDDFNVNGEILIDSISYSGNRPLIKTVGIVTMLGSSELRPQLYSLAIDAGAIDYNGVNTTSGSLKINSGDLNINSGTLKINGTYGTNGADSGGIILQGNKSIVAQGNSTLVVNGVANAVNAPEGTLLVTSGANVTITTDGSRMRAGTLYRTLAIQNISVQGTGLPGQNGKLTVKSPNKNNLITIHLGKNGLIDINKGGFDFSTEFKSYTPITMNGLTKGFMNINMTNAGIEAWKNTTNINSVTPSNLWRPLSNASLTLKGDSRGTSVSQSAVDYSDNSLFGTQFLLQNYGRISNMKFIR